MDNSFQESLIDLSLIKATKQKDNRLTEILNRTPGTSHGSQQVHEPVAGQKFSKTKCIEEPLKIQDSELVENQIVRGRLYISAP